MTLRMWMSLGLMVGAMVCGRTEVVLAHCQVPCGIYDDHSRIDLLLEDVETIEKAMQSIATLEKSKKPNHNQLVRWITAKEQHAQNIQAVIAHYFLAQRITDKDVQYEEKLKALHNILVTAMKCKQTLDLAEAGNLRKWINTFHELYHPSHIKKDNL